MNKIYKVTLTFGERQDLTAIISKGKHPAYKIQHAHILLVERKESELIQIACQSSLTGGRFIL